MENKMNNEVIILGAEKYQIELAVREQIKSLRKSLDILESKLDSKEKLSEYDGLQEVTVHIDRNVSKLSAYTRAIELLSK